MHLPAQTCGRVGHALPRLVAAAGGGSRQLEQQVRQRFPLKLQVELQHRSVVVLLRVELALQPERARHQLDGAAVCRSQRFSLGLRSRGAKQVNLPAGEDHAHENYAEAHCEEQRAAQQRAALDDQRVLLPVLSQQGGQHGRGAEPAPSLKATPALRWVYLGG